MRKDIKKSSYYVWFLGAQEAKGLRGSKYVNPVIRSLIEREREVEPFKVTLQVSYKGLKIIQNLPNNASSANSTDKTSAKNNRKSDIVKHFIPHHAVTCVLQDEDIVACILLLYNPATKCPVHVHAYRCDSVETATILSGQLQILIERPENQKKLSEIEVRLKAKGLLISTPPPGRRLQKNPPPVGSDTKSSSSRDSEFSRASSSERISGFAQQERIASLYDSLAAELREKLNTGDPQPHSPILLPPRDYDTVHRQKGNLSGIDLRRCLSMNIVGMNVANNSRTPDGKTTGFKQTHTGGGGGAKVDSSGASSGIGSDHAPSPDQESDARFLDSHSTSDEDLNAGLPLYLEKAGGCELSLPRPGRMNNFPDSSPLSVSSSGPHEYHLGHRGHRIKSNGDENSPIVPHPDPDSSIHRVHRQYNPESANPNSFHHKIKAIDNFFVNKDTKVVKENKNIVPQSQVSRSETPQSKLHRSRKNAEERQRSPSPESEKWLNTSSLTPRDRFNDAKEKFLLLERERLEEEKLQRAVHNHNERRRINQAAEPPAFTEIFPTPHSRKSWSRSKASDDDLEDNQHVAEYFFGNENDFRFSEEREHIKPVRHDASYQKIRCDDINDSESFTMRHESEQQYSNSSQRDDVNMIHSSHFDQSVHMHGTSAIPKSRKHYDKYPSPRHESNQEIKKREEQHGIPTQNSPRPMPRIYSEDPITDEIPPILRVKPLKGHINSTAFTEDDTVIPLERYRNPSRVSDPPRPTPRHQHYPSFSNEQEDNRHDYRHLSRPENHYHPCQNKFENNSNSFRSMHDAIQDERRRNSNEIANEFKRRSYQAHQGYQELEEFERHPGLDRETARVHYPITQNPSTKTSGHGESSTPSPRYRHSYAESFLHHQPQIPHNHELLHRNNSSVSTSRVGIAAIHPY